MNKSTLLSFIILFTIMAFSTAVAQEKKDKKKPDQMLRHVVLFKFKESASAADIAGVEAAFKDLSKKLKSVKDFEWGTNNSPENLNQGLTHCFILTFHSEIDRDEYLTHPDHMAFVEILKPHFDKATVVDYWVKK